MKCWTLYLMLGVVVICTAPLLIAAAKVGQAAPDFTATASNGKTFHLYDYRGKYVVLEWHNNGCPYVGKHYKSGNMQRLQKEWTRRKVLWFTIISSAPGKQGHVTASEENEYLAKMQAAATAALLDPTGEIGHLYDAKTSPQMVVINPRGIVIYDGAIDDKPTSMISLCQEGKDSPDTLRRSAHKSFFKLFGSRLCLSAIVLAICRTRHPFAVSATSGLHRRLS